MKWPETLTVVRHGESVYNALRDQKNADPRYAEFKRAHNRMSKDPGLARDLAQALLNDGSFVLDAGDHDTPLNEIGKDQAEKTGHRLAGKINLPDVVFVSPYLRTHQTLEHMSDGWPALKTIKVVEDERLREQEHGTALLYNDWRIFQALHPEQVRLRELQGPYWYRYPQGENVPDARERSRSWLGAVTRDYYEQNVLSVTHHLSILALRANLERLGVQEFIDLDEQQKPLNCGVTIYRGDNSQGGDGKLLLDIYNQQLY